MSWTGMQTAQELERLLVDGVVGLYQSFEITEVLGFATDRKPTNLLTVAVAEPMEAPAAIPGRPFVNGSPLLLKNCEWKLGVARYRVSLASMVETVRVFARTGHWQAGLEPLQFGTMAAVAPQYVPVDELPKSSWNRVLKNNFFQGAHVLELFDTTKAHVRFLLDDPRRLVELVEAVRPYAPIGLDGMSDRLGNVLIQLPVTVVASRAVGLDNGSHSIEVSWHPKVPPRPLRVTSEIYRDLTIEGFDSVEVEEGTVKLALEAGSGGIRSFLWDEQNRVLLGATSVTNFVTSTAFSSHVVLDAPPGRQFLEPNDGRHLVDQQVFLKPRTEPRVLGSSPVNPREPWQAQRLFAEAQDVLHERKEFLQYGATTGRGRADALGDLRQLIRDHGAEGVWLWDPYLSADDVLHTLFHCPYEGVALKALSGAQQVVAHGSAGACKRKGVDDGTGDSHTTLRSSGSRSAKWVVDQAARLSEARGNCLGLALEFRARTSSVGWRFHDRFLVFPRAGRSALAWSLGTSVNSLGNEHHILQKVPNGQLIANAFSDLWDKLASQQCLVWKTP